MRITGAGLPDFFTVADLVLEYASFVKPRKLFALSEMVNEDPGSIELEGTVTRRVPIPPFAAFAATST
jgi:hypothetical protein